MKRLTFTFLLIAGIFIHLQAQLTIADDNNVGINETSPDSELSINGAGNTYSTLYVENSTNTSSQRCAQFNKSVSGDNGSDYSYSVWSHIAHNGGYKLVGGLFQATSASLTNNRTFGIYGKAGNGRSGYNYGVYGNLYGSNDGAAIVGTTSSAEPVIPGKYAGYFIGNVHVVGNITYSGSCTQSSDTRLKKDIRPLSTRENTQLDKLKTLTAIKYYRKNPAELNLFDASVIDTMKVDPRTIEYTDEIYTKETIGLSAQEVQAVYPELVKENNDGFLSLNYVGLIPILIEAIKEQDLAIEALDLTVQTHEEALQMHSDSLHIQAESLQIQTAALQIQTDSIKTQSQAIQILEEALQLQEQNIQDLNETSRSQAEDIKVLKEEIDKLKSAATTE